MKNLTKSQKAILMIAFPIAIFIVTAKIAYEQSSSGDIFDWNDTWLTWLLAVGLVTGFEYWLNTSYEN